MLELNINPTEKHLDEIKNWLKDELDKTGEGFYVHWEMITKAFTEKRLIVATKKDSSIGFVVYRIYDLTCVIDIVEIKPTERKKGIGKKMIKETLKFLKTKGFSAVELYCSPESSEAFWKKIGFLNFPEFYRDSKINMYKSIIDTLQPTKKLNSKNVIHLWEDTPNRMRDSKPNWIWNLSFIKNTKVLTKPIIFPAMTNWKIKLVINEKTIFEDEINYFESVKSYCGSFMIIEEINF
jgi:predicted GNAT family acetyltransferase